MSILLAAGAAKAQVRVGEKLSVNFQTVDGKKFSTRDLSGRLVVLDFWATWCGPCVAQIPHMVRINDELGPKGVQIVGISLDNDKSAMERMVEERKMDWLHVCDGRGWASEHARRFGINGIPHVILLSPDGEVLWNGHPANLDAALDDAMARFGTQLKKPGDTAKAEAREQALSVIKEATDALHQQDLRAALVSLMSLDKETISDPKVSSALRDLSAKLLEEARKEENAQKLAADTEGPKLLEQLETISKYARPAPVTGVYGNVGLDRALDDQKPTPVAAGKAADAPSDSEKLEALATRKLAQAERAATAGRDVEAYELFLRISELWPDTSAGPEAAKRVQAFQADAAFMQKYEKLRLERGAKALLNMAASYRDAGQNDKAAEALNQVLEQYPGTAFADDAKRQLKELK